MIVDCMTCPAHAQRCADCVVTVLRGPALAEQPASLVRPASDELLLSGELQLSDHLLSSGERQLSGDLQLDAAESRAVSVFVGAGLVTAGAAARIRARRDSVQPWAAARDTG